MKQTKEEIAKENYKCLLDALTYGTSMKLIKDDGTIEHIPIDQYCKQHKMISPTQIALKEAKKYNKLMMKKLKKMDTKSKKERGIE